MPLTGHVAAARIQKIHVRDVDVEERERTMPFLGEYFVFGHEAAAVNCKGRGETIFSLF